jgi:hypothetical protein
VWKLLVGFIVFAVGALLLLRQFGADLDMGGEKHSVDAHAPGAASAPEAAASPASGPASWPKPQ